MFWVREIAGWALVAIGLAAFWFCYHTLIPGRPVDAGPMVLIGIFLFRGGIHLLKVAVAARICQRPESNKARAVNPARLR